MSGTDASDVFVFGSSDAGLDATEAAPAAYLQFVYVSGSIALEVADHHEPGLLPPEAERIATRRTIFSAALAEDYPRTAAAQHDCRLHLHRAERPGPSMDSRWHRSTGDAERS